MHNVTLEIKWEIKSFSHTKIFLILIITSTIYGDFKNLSFMAKTQFLYATLLLRLCDLAASLVYPVPY